VELVNTLEIDQLCGHSPMGTYKVVRLVNLPNWSMGCNRAGRGSVKQ
jgi:hypothetical protein